MKAIILLFVLASAQLCYKVINTKMLPDNITPGPPAPPDIEEYAQDDLDNSVYHKDEHEKDDPPSPPLPPSLPDIREYATPDIFKDDKDYGVENEEDNDDYEDKNDENLSGAFDGFPYNKKDIESDDNDDENLTGTGAYDGFPYNEKDIENDDIDQVLDWIKNDKKAVNTNVESRDSFNSVDDSYKNDILDETDLDDSTEKRTVKDTNTCTDHNPNCEYWAEGGGCTTNPRYMKDNCRKACAICKATINTCTDHNIYCEDWAKMGGCTTNPQYMEVKCRKACALCKNPTTMSNQANEAFAECEDERSANVQCSNAVRDSPFRTVTGVCNNLIHKTWGATQTALRRIVPADYVDGITIPRGFPGTTPSVPTANQVSRAIFNVETTNNGNRNKLTVLFMTFGQFLDHDMTEILMSMCRLKEFGFCSNLQESFNSTCFPILFDPPNPECTNFGRSHPICPKNPSNPGVRQQPNELTAFIDASQIYGAEEELFQELRVLDDESGELKVNNQKDNLMPVASVPKGFTSCSLVKEVMGERTSECRTLGGCSLVGDLRGDENIALHSFHTIWLREHNRIARELKKMNPQWKGETVFQTARKIIGAQWQHLVYKEYLPQLVNVPEYISYKPDVNPSITQAFAAAAFRYGHSLIPNSFQQNDKNFDAVKKPLLLQEAFFNREKINFNGIEHTVFGLVANKSNEVDNNFAFGIARKLFVRPGEMFHHDLLALNIQRGRDHGLPTYGAYRKECGLSKLNSWNDLTKIMLPQAVASFQTVYRNPNDIDLFAAGISEIHLNGLNLGPTFQCLIGRQFVATRDGDRFYYENPGVFSPRQLVAIQKVTMASLLCSNLKGIVSIQPQALFVPDNHHNRRVSCSRIPTLNLKPWQTKHHH